MVVSKAKDSNGCLSFSVTFNVSLTEEQLTATFPSLLAVASMAYFLVAMAKELWDLKNY